MVLLSGKMREAVKWCDRAIGNQKYRGSCNKPYFPARGVGGGGRITVVINERWTGGESATMEVGEITAHLIFEWQGSVPTQHRRRGRKGKEYETPLTRVPTGALPLIPHSPKNSRADDALSIPRQKDLKRMGRICAGKANPNVNDSLPLGIGIKLKARGRGKEPTQKRLRYNLRLRKSKRELNWTPARGRVTSGRSKEAHLDSWSPLKS